MVRRQFLAGLAGALTSLRLPAFQQARGKQRISAVEIWRLDGHRETLSPYHDSANPVKRNAPVSALYVKIKAGQGLEGVYGPVDKEAALVVDEQLRPFLIGKDALAVESLWDQMYRSNRHSRRGLFLMGISAVDNALWDLRGRYCNAPVYRLLGGPTRTSVEAYASCAGYSLEPEALRKRAALFKDQGYRYQKWFCAWGPGDGPPGLLKNVELVRTLRETVGEDVALMFDAICGWDMSYALEWAKQVERHRPHWIEEAFHPEKIESFATLRRSIGFPVAAGEHLYGCWEVEQYLSAGALNVVQADPEWCGGVSELVRICAVASLYDAQVIPHGHSLHAALHVVASQPPMTCPLVEYLPLKMESYYHFEKDVPQTVGGRVMLPDRPGFGIEFDPAKVEKQTLVTWS
jgi:L-alanine-DL-glutamate epimerase-like enolase superfamily enzyme